MTVLTTDNRRAYTGDGSTSVFPFPVRFLADTDVKVAQRISDVEVLLTIGTDYSVSGAGEAAGGSVSFTIAPAAGVPIVIYNDPPMTQDVDYQEDDEFPANTHERALDKLTILVQRLAGRLSRALLYDETADIVLTASQVLGRVGDAETARDQAQAAHGASEIARADAHTAALTATMKATEAGASATSAAASLSAVEADAMAASDAAAAASDDQVAVAADRVLAEAAATTATTKADETSADAVLTAADRVATGDDRTASAASAASAAADAASAAASAGQFQLATQAQAEAGTDNLAYMSALRVAQAVAALAGSGSPSGAVMWFAANTPPEGWLKANGAAVSRTTYADLFAVVGTTFGTGDGSTTFNIPDLRGEFIRGWDDGRGADSGRSFGSWQSHDFERHNHVLTHSGSHGGAVIGNSRSAYYSNKDYPNNGSPWSTASTGGTETRPRNVALLACIKS